MQSNVDFVKRARGKYFSVRLALALIQYNLKSILLKSYRNSFYCAHQWVMNEEGRLKTKYCRNRWCIYCSRIRASMMFEGYFPQLKKFEDPQFVTLTAPTVIGKYLRPRIKIFEDVWRQITRQAKNERRSKNPLFTHFKGIRKMECTLRPQGRYHYHYHVLVDGKVQAEWLLSQWLKRVKAASKKAQDMRPADEGSMRELFKYFTKLMAKDEGLFPTEERFVGQFIRLDFLFRALRGKRVYQSFGGVKKVSEEMEDLIPEVERPEGLFGEIWKWCETTWVSEHGELLVDYKPSEQIIQVLSRTPDQEKKAEIMKLVTG